MLTLSSHSLQLDTNPSPHSLASRGFDQDRGAFCTYTHYNFADGDTVSTCYTFLISLPWYQWEDWCSNSMLMHPMLLAIERRCRQKWAENGLVRKFEDLSARLGEEYCQITIQITVEPGKNKGYPWWWDDCLIKPMPPICGLTGDDLQWIPWPSQYALIERARYTSEEDKRLIELKESGLSWREIAGQFPGRSRVELQDRYEAKLRPPPLPGRRSAEWTTEDNKLLISGRDNGLKWKEIAEVFQRRGRERTVSALRTQYGKIRHQV